MFDLSRTFRRAFTLIEVNFAIFIMAGGVLAMTSLYSLGCRSSRQSRDDVAASVFADAVLNPLVIVLSATNVTWRQWCDVFNGCEFDARVDVVNERNGGGNVCVLPEKKGWFGYGDTRSSKENRDQVFFRVRGNPKSIADGVYRKLIGINGEGQAPRARWNLPNTPELPEGITYALVASRDSKYSPVTTLAVRCVRENLLGTLMAQPVFSTEVHFQGDPNK